jgi:hypothetical protein
MTSSEGEDDQLTGRRRRNFNPLIAQRRSLVKWNVDVLANLLKQVPREGMEQVSHHWRKKIATSETVLEEVKEIIHLPTLAGIQQMKTLS